MKTNSKQVKTAVQSYITKAIDTSDYPEVKNDIKSQLEFIWVVSQFEMLNKKG